ncbi:hypothetical protein F5887DRAFT_900439, partial [Amanita rubescens]
GEAEHQKVKKHYKRASKHAFTHGIAKQNRRERTLRKMRNRKRARDLIDSAKEPLATDRPSTKSSTPKLHFKNQEKLPYTSPEVHYHMSSETKHKIKLATWLPEHKDDPAFHVSHPDILTIILTFVPTGLSPKAARPPLDAASRIRI